MKTSNIWDISHDDFVKLITPSFSAVDEVEDMDAIMARTHFIVITDNGIYYRVAATTKTSINFIPWGNEPKDLLAQSQVEIFKAYKLNPHGHKLPPSYHEDCAWSQEVLRRLLNGENVPQSYTINRPRGLFGDALHLSCANSTSNVFK